MSSRSAQAPSAVIIIRPHHFQTNDQTAHDNMFQRTVDAGDHRNVKTAAFDEVNHVICELETQGIKTHVFDDETADTPDSVFPNNWFSTHAGGHVAVYPMYAENRRRERRSDVIDMLKRTYRVQDVIDYTGLEEDKLFLEGTGAMVLDHIDRVAYAVNSNRANSIALERFCTHFNYEPMVFEAKDAKRTPIYHTNVLMCIATSFVMIGLDLIPDKRRRTEVVRRIEDSGREVIGLSNHQIENFAGNAMELQGKDVRLLALSSRAFATLTQDQIDVIERSLQLLPLDVPTIEMAGGSVRCMLAGIHLSAR